MWVKCCQIFVGAWNELIRVITGDNLAKELGYCFAILLVVMLICVVSMTTLIVMLQIFIWVEELYTWIRYRSVDVEGGTVAVGKRVYLNVSCVVDKEVLCVSDNSSGDLIFKVKYPFQDVQHRITEHKRRDFEFTANSDSSFLNRKENK